MSLIKLDDISVNYDSQADEDYALQDFSITIEQGSIVGVIGPSGAGKSTLLRTIASYIPNYFDCSLEGNAIVDGASVREVSIGEMSMKVGMLFENPFDQLTGATTTVFEEVAYGLENQGLPREKILQRTWESLKRVGITDLMDRNPYELSGGQSQRVALAAILALRPDVLLLDEPTSQLDPSGTEEVFSTVESMDTVEYTTVIVSQNLDHLAPLADRLLVLEDGELQGDGTTREMLTGSLVEEDLFFIPDVVRIGSRLRNEGLVPSNNFLPLTEESLLRELRSTVSIGTGPPKNNNWESSRTASNPQPDQALIEFEDVYFSYDDIDALEGVSLSIGSGCTCVIGQNGAGKTTFAKHLNGLLKPTDGRVLINGQDTQNHRVAQLAKTVGLSFQNPDNQLFHETVVAEVQYGPKNLGYDEAKVRDLAEQAIDRLKLSDIAHKHPYDLGLAERKRVAVASVLAMDTEVVVLDEPTGGQDTEGVAILGNVVEELIAQNKTVVVITHDMKFARDYADRILALRQGKILTDGTPRTVFGQFDTLKKTDVYPPQVTKLARRLGLDSVVLNIDELFQVQHNTQ